MLSRRRRLRRRQRQEGVGRCKWADGPNRPRSGSGRGPCCRSVVAFTASTARFRKRTADLGFFWLYSKTLGHRQDRLVGSNRRVDDVSMPSALPNPEIGRLDVNADGEARQLGLFRAAQLYDPRGRLALETRPPPEGGKFTLRLLHLSI